MLITHYQASWVDIHPYQGPVHYPGLSVKEEDLKNVPPDLAEKVRKRNGVWNFEVLEEKIAEPLQLARETGLQLYCGEWGAYSKAPAEDRLRWYRDIRRLFDKHNIAWATWEYKSRDFGIVGNDGQELNPELTQILVGE
jgi:endoglucanase